MINTMTDNWLNNIDKKYNKKYFFKIRLLRFLLLTTFLYKFQSTSFYFLSLVLSAKPFVLGSDLIYFIYLFLSISILQQFL